MIDTIVAIVLALVVIGFIVLYLTGKTGQSISQEEIDAQISRCCPKIIEAENNNQSIFIVKCVDDPKLIKMINAETGSHVTAPARISLLVSNFTSWDHIADICGYQN